MTVTISRPNQALIIPPGTWPGETFGTLPDGRLAIPHNVNNTLLLRAAGYKIPHPMEEYYGWPGDKKPYDVQRRTAYALTSNRRFYCLNQQGTGKTATTLWAWDCLRGLGEAGKLLVVAKLSTLNFVWAREVMRVLPHRRCVVLGSLKGMSKATRLKALEEDAEIFIINHDGLKVIEDAVAARSDIDTIVLDELAVYRNNSDRSKRMRSFAGRFKWVWGLTGSPMPNEVTDVWSQCKILTPTTVPKYFKACRELLMNRVSQYEWRPKKDAVETAYAMMQPSARFQLDDVLELPPISEQTIDCELSDEQKSFYTQFTKKLAIMVRDKQITAANAGGVVNKLLQISGGWVYSTAPDFVKLDATPRLNLLRDLIEGNDRKVLVFAPYRHMVAGVAAFLNSKEGLGANTAAAYDKNNGGDQVLFEFQDTPRYKCLVSHPGPIGHGNTLTAANLIVWYSPLADYDIFDQANFRIRRISQEHKQRIIYIQATSADRRFYSILRRKELTQDAFLSLVEEATRE
jgi:SNF2 family DNA or RNA helicase